MNIEWSRGSGIIPTKSLYIQCRITHSVLHQLPPPDVLSHPANTIQVYTLFAGSGSALTAIVIVIVNGLERRRV